MATDIKAADFYNRCEFFASARAGARSANLGPEKNFETRYFPTLGGKRVRPPGMTDDGFAFRGLAVAAAREFKKLCRDCLEHRAPR